MVPRWSTRGGGANFTCDCVNDSLIVNASTLIGFAMQLRGSTSTCRVRGFGFFLLSHGTLCVPVLNCVPVSTGANVSNCLPHPFSVLSPSLLLTVLHMSKISNSQEEQHLLSRALQQMRNVRFLTHLRALDEAFDVFSVFVLLTQACLRVHSQSDLTNAHATFYFSLLLLLL